MATRLIISAAEMDVNAGLRWACSPACGVMRRGGLVFKVHLIAWLILFNLVKSAGWHGQNAPGRDHCVPLLYYAPEEARSPTRSSVCYV